MSKFKTSGDPSRSADASAAFNSEYTAAVRRLPNQRVVSDPRVVDAAKELRATVPDFSVEAYLIAVYKVANIAFSYRPNEAASAANLGIEAMTGAKAVRLMRERLNRAHSSDLKIEGGQLIHVSHDANPSEREIISLAKENKVINLMIGVGLASLPKEYALNETAEKSVSADVFRELVRITPS